MTAPRTSYDDEVEGYRYPRRYVYGSRNSSTADVFLC